jgi:hypothetical protein
MRLPLRHPPPCPPRPPRSAGPARYPFFRLAAACVAGGCLLLASAGALAPRLAGRALPAPAAAAAPRLEPLPADLERRMTELVRAAERYRGLRLKRRVPWGRVSEPELRREVLADLHEDLPPARLAAVELSLKALGLIPESMDLEAYYPQLLTSQIAGFYDPHRKVLAVVDRPGGLLGREAAAEFGAELVRKMEDGLLVHELTHVLQDQHFDLDRLSDPDPLSDPGVARLALVEGDASLVMFDELVQMPIEKLAEARDLLGQLLSDVGTDDGAPAAGMKLPGEKEMAAAPPWFREMLLFSYSQGAAFCLEVRRRGGQKLLDHAFAADPPRSSEQILHPEKWYGRRDDPIKIVWPDLGRELPGYAKAAEGQLGEEGIRVLLRSAASAGGGAAAGSGPAVAGGGKPAAEGGSPAARSGGAPVAGSGGAPAAGSGSAPVAGSGGAPVAGSGRAPAAGAEATGAPAASAAAATAAAGWGGDRFAVYQRPAEVAFRGEPSRESRASAADERRPPADPARAAGASGGGSEGRGARRLLAWIVDWDTEEAAARFQAAAAAHLGPSWTVTRAAPRRVTLLRGELDEAERPGVLARLAAARAEPPANRPIDLKRLGHRVH